VAIDGIRVPGALDALLARYRVGDSVIVHAFRRDELMTFKVRLLADSASQIGLQAEAKPALVPALRTAWLAGRSGR
jgi:predicted metalloprotease with PDZ domain